MSVNSEHVTGFVVGLGAAALGFYMYKRNQSQVDAWLRQQGINVPQPSQQAPANMSFEDLVTEKERLEDVIAEREAAAGSGESSSATPK